jgi:hypothetical protein
MKNHRISAILACVILLLNAPSLADAGPRLVVRDYRTQKPIVQIPVDYGQAITMRYVHSIDLSPVFEVFRVDEDNGLVLEETCFRMFGAGMAHWPGHGRLVGDGKWTRIVEINRALGGFVLRIGAKGIDHTIIAGDSEINLSDIAPGRRAEVVVLD